MILSISISSLIQHTCLWLTKALKRDLQFNSHWQLKCRAAVSIFLIQVLVLAVFCLYPSNCADDLKEFKLLWSTALKQKCRLFRSKEALSFLPVLSKYKLPQVSLRNLCLITVCDYKITYCWLAFGKGGSQQSYLQSLSKGAC